MVPLLPDKSWEFHDSFVPSERAGPLVFFFFSANDIRVAFSVKRLQGSRLRQKRNTAINKTLKCSKK